LSHYSKIETQIVERDSLLQALRDAGYEHVECHDSAQSLFGYQGDVRPEKADVIVRRKYISPESNDIGFRLAEDGTYQAIISEYDQELLGEGWLGRLCQNYAEHAVVNKLKQQGFEIAERRLDPSTSKVHLTLRRV